MDERFETTVQLAESLLSSRFNGPVQLVVKERLNSRHLVLRCKLITAPGGAPSSIFLKQMAVEAPLALAPRPVDLYLNELASLRFFGDGPDQPSVGPRLVCSHDGAGILVLEDMGDHQTLREILRGDDASLASGTLVKFGQVLGRVQAATVGKEGAFSTLRGGAHASSLPSAASQDMRSARGDLDTCLDALGVKRPAGFTQEIDGLEAAIHNEESPFRTWTHCDLRPLNILVLASTQVQLLDFEFAGFGHALLDAVSVRMAFPPPPVPVISAGQRVPPAVIDRFENRYRAELMRVVPEAADDACYQEALVHACAHWALVKLLSMWKTHLQERLAQGEEYDDRADIAPHKAAYARFRQQAVAYLQTFIDTAAASGQLSALGAAARGMVAALLDIWPEIRPLDYFPAFADGGD